MNVATHEQSKSFVGKLKRHSYCYVNEIEQRSNDSKLGQVTITRELPNWKKQKRTSCDWLERQVLALSLRTFSCKSKVSDSKREKLVITRRCDKQSKNLEIQNKEPEP